MTHESLGPYPPTVRVFGVATGPGPVYTVRACRSYEDSIAQAAGLSEVEVAGCSMPVLRVVRHTSSGWVFAAVGLPCPNTGARR